MTEQEGIQWKRMSFKGNKVWVALDDSGQLRLKNQKALIKYNLDQTHEYLVPPGRLAPEDEAVPAGKTPKAPKSGDLDIPWDCIQIYTDGASSGNPGPAGIGAILIYKEKRKEISEYIGHATNNMAELIAIHRALCSLKRKDLPVRVFTDSAYALGLLTQKWKPQVNKKLVLETKDLIGQFKDIQLIKVKGHAGIKENEVADFLAVSAIKKGLSQK